MGVETLGGGQEGNWLGPISLGLGLVLSPAFPAPWISPLAQTSMSVRILLADQLRTHGGWDNTEGSEFLWNTEPSTAADCHTASLAEMTVPVL